MQSLLQLLKEIAAKKTKRFMTPGHKGGAGLSQAFSEMLHKSAGAMDISLPDEEWHWRNAQGAVYQSEKMFAELYGVERTFFSLNGTTGAIQAMLLASVGLGGKMILPRNVHRSVVAAMILADIQPVYILPEYSSALGVWLSVTKESVEEAVKKNIETKAVLLVNPNYYGIACDVAGITEMAHAHDFKVLVDEAHGAHLKFSSRLPQSAIAAGADVVAQSTHKLLGSLVQSSVLHCPYNSLVAVQALAQAMYLLQTSSPSYLLTASLAAAGQDMAINGEHLLASALALADWARLKINEIEGLYCFGEEVFKEIDPSYVMLDVTKLTVSVKELGVTGYETEKYLWEKANVQVELSDEYNVLLIITFADDREKIEYLIKALKEMVSYYRNNKVKMGHKIRATSVSEYTKSFAAVLPVLSLTPRQAYFSKKKKVLFSEAAGEIAAEAVSFYPPGIPVISYGEVVSKEIIEYCLWLKGCGAAVSGMDGDYIMVVKSCF